jgi:3-phenylpropionate/trans-cinnamate dioxygenase ferredoxin subunit
MPKVFEIAAKLDDIPDGGMVQVIVRGEPIGLYRTGDNVYAIHDICSHEEAYLTEGEFEPEEMEVECPLHGSRFHVETGAVRILPATRPITAYEVRVEDDNVLVGAEKEE